MLTLDKFDIDYLRLVLEIHAHHIDGYVDSYYGPPELKTQIESAPAKKPSELLDAVRDLQERIPATDESRQRYLTAALRGIECTIQMLNGVEFDYLDEVFRIYDIQPQLIDESRFVAAHARLDRALPASTVGNSISARLQSWRQSFEVDTAGALPLLELARIETRRRTASFVDLPDDELVELSLVKDKPWNAYNWYLGNGRSLIEFNTDIPLQASMLLSTFAHEGYPGHHTEHLLKERMLYHEKGYAEQAAMLLHSPSAVIAEGIATTALEMIFPDGEHHQWNADVLLPAAKIPTHPDMVEQMRIIAESSSDLRYVNSNAAIFYHTGKLNRSETIDYLQNYGLVNPQRAEKSFNFISHPLFRSYVFTYSVGQDLINKTTNPFETFRRLLVNQVLPSDLALTGNRNHHG